jgi:hypothetical protein
MGYRTNPGPAVEGSYRQQDEYKAKGEEGDMRFDCPGNSLFSDRRRGVWQGFSKQAVGKGVSRSTRRFDASFDDCRMLRSGINNAHGG